MIWVRHFSSFWSLLCLFHCSFLLDPLRCLAKTQWGLQVGHNGGCNQCTLPSGLP